MNPPTLSFPYPLSCKIYHPTILKESGEGPLQPLNKGLQTTYVRKERLPSRIHFTTETVKVLQLLVLDIVEDNN